MCFLKGWLYLSSSLLPLSPHLAKIRVKFSHWTWMAFAISEGTSFSVCFSVPFCLLNCVCLGRLESVCVFAAGVFFFPVSFRRCTVVLWGFAFRSPGGCFPPSLYLSLFLFAFVLVFGAATFFRCPVRFYVDKRAPGLSGRPGYLV